MSIYPTWLALVLILDDVGLSNMVGVRYYHVLMWVSLTWLVIPNLSYACVDLSNMFGVGFYHELVSVYPTWLWLLSYAAGGLSNMVGVSFNPGLCGFI